MGGFTTIILLYYGIIRYYGLQTGDKIARESTREHNMSPRDKRKPFWQVFLRELKSSDSWRMAMIYKAENRRQESVEGGNGDCCNSCWTSCFMAALSRCGTVPRVVSAGACTWPTAQKDRVCASSKTENVAQLRMTFERLLWGEIAPNEMGAITVISNMIEHDRDMINVVICPHIHYV